MRLPEAAPNEELPGSPEPPDSLVRVSNAQADPNGHALSGWPRHRSKWTAGRVAAISILCAGLMALSFQARPVAAESGGGAGEAGAGNNTTGTVVYPYAIPAGLFPTPANLSSGRGIAAVSVIPFPGSPTSYAVVNASTPGNGSGASVWFSVAGYSPADAKLIATNGSCGTGCGDLPISWTNLSLVTTFPGPVTALQVVSIGSAVVVGATSGNVSYLFAWSASQQAWVDFGLPISGRLAAMSTDPSEVVVATLSSAGVSVTTVSASGTVLASPPPLDASGGGDVMSAGVVLAPAGAGFDTYVVFAVNGTDQLYFSESANGAGFSAPTQIGAFAPLPPPSEIDSVGQTMLEVEGGTPGQVSLVAAGSELVLLYTTYSDGQVIPVTQASGDGGIAWQGSYFSGPIDGTAVDPILTVGPTGYVYAAWEDPDFGPGTVEEATYEPDGLPVVPPEAIASAAQNGTYPTGAPSIAVDAFAQPLLLWPASPPTLPGSIAYTGGYLPANGSLNLTEELLNQSLGAWDFADPSTSTGGLASFEANASATLATATSDLENGELCPAQNLTALDLYQNLTHVPLSVVSGSGTVCASNLRPSATASPLLGSVGVESPNTYLAVYVDWALEAEGVPVAVSPLSAVTTFSPYTQEIPAATLPAPESASKTVSGETATVTVAPTPYSPTAYELSVTDTLPTWDGDGAIYTACEEHGPLERFAYSTVTKVTKTWENVSLDNGTVHTFLGTTSWPTVWVYNLSTYQTYFWHATFAAQTTETETMDDPCTGGTLTYTYDPGSPALPTMTVSGTFATTLTVVPGSDFVTAAFNSAHSAARLTVQFNSTLPATIRGVVSNSSGAQSWSTTSDAINGAYTLPAYSGASQGYTISVGATSRLGVGSSPGPPGESFAETTYGASPAQTASASCSFTLSSSVPTVSISNASGAPYTSVNASTVNVTWNSTADTLGFFTYFEIGTPLNWTVTGIEPTRGVRGTWVYSLELHGLEPMVAYNATFGVSWNQGCLVEEDEIVGQAFSTDQDPAFLTDTTLSYVWEQGLPYDSITRVGGGVEIGWNTPSNSSLGAGTHTLSGGYVQIWNASSRIVVPFVPAQVTENVTNPTGRSSGTNLVNLTSSTDALAPNQEYDFKVVANYTYTKKVLRETVQLNESAASRSHPQPEFRYLQSSSDDGLADAEKEAGWTVPLAPRATFRGKTLPVCLQASPGSAAAQACASDPSAVVTANPADYATNGLVSDYVEKEYDLNPNTLDTAGSHMLDTWNLTFELGAGSPTLPRQNYFHYYYENGTYNFSQSCQQSGAPGGSCSFTPEITTRNNLTCLKQGATCGKQGWVGDSTPWASTVLWPSSALTSLEKVMVADQVGWIRAVTGSYGNQRTITVWGKLSWGANPLTTSTSHDGLTDGNQLDPLGPVIFQVDLSAWEDWAVPSDGGASAAPYISISALNGTTFYQGYGPCSPGANCPVGSFDLGSNPPYNYILGWSGAYNVSVPIVSSGQYVDWDVQIFDNASASGLPFLTASVVNSTTYWAISSWEEANLPNFGHEVAVDLDLWNESDVNAGSNGREGFVALNYTVLTEPLKANTLLVTPANATTLSSTPWGLKRYVGEPDFDLLVLNLTNASGPLTVSGIGNAEGTGTYSVTLDPGLNNVLVPRGIFVDSPLGQALLNDSDLTLPYAAGVEFSGSYWSSRALGEATPPSDPDFIRVFAPANESQGNSSVSGAALGGLPGNPGLEAGYESRQVQAVLWMNISAVPSESLGGTGELLNLLGGLVLNSSGNVTTDVLPITGALPTLDLPVDVLSLLANYTVPNDGAYPAPQYDPALAQHPWTFGQFLGEVWNSLSGIASFVVNGVERFASVVWSTDTAAQAYIDGAVAGGMAAISHGLNELANQAVAGLEAVAKVMEWALDELVDHVFEPLLQPLINADTAYTQALGADLPAGNPIQFWNDYSGTFFLLIVGFAAAATLAFTIMEGMCVGVSLLATLIVTLIVAGASIYGNSHRSAFAGLSPYSPSITTRLGSILPNSSSALNVDLKDLASMLSALTTTWAVQDVESATTPTPVWTSAWGTALGIVALLTASVAEYFGSVADAVVSLSFDVASVILDFLDMWHNPAANIPQDEVTAALDIAAGGLDVKVFLFPGVW